MNVIKKNFVYLVSTADRLNSYFDTFKHDDADVYALSWRDFDESWENHIDGRGTLCGEGRNRLFEHALKSGPYRFFIFVDDDVRLNCIKPEGPTRAYEKFLLEYEPAVCGISNPEIGSGWKHRDGQYNSTHYFDRQMIAYHIETVGTALPICTFANEQSPQYSTIPVNAISTVMYPNSKFQFNEVFIRPTAEIRGPHPYPRNHGRGTQYGTFDQFSDNFVAPAMGRPVPRWASSEAVGTPQRKKGTYIKTEREMESAGLVLDSPIWENILHKWNTIKPTWWDVNVTAMKEFYEKNPEGSWWEVA